MDGQCTRVLSQRAQPRPTPQKSLTPGELRTFVPPIPEFRATSGIIGGPRSSVCFPGDTSTPQDAVV